MLCIHYVVGSVMAVDWVIKKLFEDPTFAWKDARKLPRMGWRQCLTAKKICHVVFAYARSTMCMQLTQHKLIQSV
jgi:hypothetical protein